jgi:hypothetical protein
MSALDMEKIATWKVPLIDVEIDLGALIKSLKKPIVAKRFLGVFAEHGVAATQIPRFFLALTLDQLDSPEALLPAITPGLIEATAKLFGVRREWLEGVGDVIYDRDWCHKRPHRLFRALREFDWKQSRFPLRVLYSAKKLDWKSERSQPLVVLCVEKIQDLGETEILRFRIFDRFDWSHPPSRIHLKAIARVWDQTFHQITPLYRVSEKELEAVAEGREIPRKFLRGSPVTSPSLEDFALSAKESCQAKEIDELPSVLQCVEKYDYLKSDDEGD